MKGERFIKCITNTRIWATVRSLFENLPQELQKAAATAVYITEAVKDFDDQNPEVADIIAAIIPRNADDKLLAWLRQTIPVILTELRLINSTRALTDPQQITAAAIITLRSLHGDIKSAFLHDFSVLMAQEITKFENGELKWSDAVYIVEWYYQHKFKTA